MPGLKTIDPWVCPSATVPSDLKIFVELIKETFGCNHGFHGHYWWKISAESKSFISAVIIVGHETRPIAAQALGHAWLSHTSEEEHDLTFEPDREQCRRRVRRVRQEGE